VTRILIRTRSCVGAAQLVILLATLLAATACGGGGGAGSTDTPLSCTPSPLPASVGPMTALEEQFAREVFVLVNEHRSGLGLPAFTWHSGGAGTAGAAQAAYDHSADMEIREYFSHTSVGCQTPGDRLTAAGVTWTAWAENIAQGQATPAAVMTSWLNSAGHRDNIESLAVTQLGVGVRDGVGGPWWTQVFFKP